MALGFIFGEGQKARTPDDLKKMRATLEALRGQSRMPRNVGEGLTAIGEALAYRRDMADLEKGEAASRAAGKGIMSEIMGALGGGGSTGYGGGGIPTGATSPDFSDVKADTNFKADPKIKEGIASTATALGVDPTDLATAISYETGGTFDPTQGGPTTKWGRHRGLIQFGEPQAAKYGVNWDDPIGSQLGPDGAVAKYLRDTGVKPGMGLMDIYSAINAGGVGRYNRSDAAAGGAPGTVADKVNNQMAGHRAKALAMFGGGTTPAAAAIESVAPVQTASLDPSAGMTGIFQPGQPLQSVDRPALEANMNSGAQPMSPNQRIAQAFAPVQAENVTPKAGRVLPQNDQTQRVLGALLNPQPMGGEFAGMQPPETTAAIPQPVAAPQPSPELPGTQVMGVGGAAGRTAPINGQGGQFPPAPGQASQGAFPPAPSMPGQLDMNRLIELAADPNTPELGQMIVQTLLKQRLTPPDPMDALNRQKTELEIQKSKRDLETPKAGFRQATPEESAAYGSPAGQFGPDGRFYPVNPPSGTSLSVDPTTGAVTFNQGAGVKPLTESQSKLTLFQSLQTETQPVLLDLEKQFDPANISDAAARSTPIAGNFFQSEQGQIYQSAATAWAEGALRIATGAAATPEEMERTKKAYFAQPGDTPNTIAFKAQMREMYNRAIDRSLGKEATGSLPKPGDFAKTFKGGGQNADIPLPQTQEEFEALPSGSIYIDPEDGKQYRKP